MNYVFPLSSPSSVQFSGGTCQRLIQTSYSSGILLDGSFLASHCSQHVDRCPSSVSHHKRPYGCFTWPDAEGCASAAFNPLAAQRCILCI